MSEEELASQDLMLTEVFLSLYQIFKRVPGSTGAHGIKMIQWIWAHTKIHTFNTNSFKLSAGHSN